MRQTRKKTKWITKNKLFFFQMELVIQLEHFRILLCTEHYHQNRYHTTTFVHLQTVQTVKIDATMHTFINVILKYDNCILMVFDFRASQKIALSVCFHAIQFPHVISSICFFLCYISSSLNDGEKKKLYFLTCDHVNNFFQHNSMKNENVWLKWINN